MRSSVGFAIVALLSACDGERERQAMPEARITEKRAAAPPSQFTEVAETQASEKRRDSMHAQVLLDRAGFSPGVIDGKDGESLKLALRGFQEARGIKDSGTLDDETRTALAGLANISPTRLVRIPRDFARQAFMGPLPKDTAMQAKLPALGYGSLMEALAERFHTTSETLIALNSPQTLSGPNRVFRVPNIAEATETLPQDTDRGWLATLQSLGVDAMQKQAAKVVVDKFEGVLKVFDAADALIAQFPATMGSACDPLPLGTWKIQGISQNPEFHYNPKLFWDVSDNKEAVLLPPGPNGPVGVAWLDLSKPHYGIHGTPEPQKMGRAESHGCVRLANWDVACLAQMVGKLGITAVFQS